MFAYQFIARDRAGLVLVGIDDGSGEWVGTREQWAEADFQETFFLNEGVWFEPRETF